MNNKMIWAYMLYLSDHMWDDESSSSMLYMPKVYREETSTEVQAWDDIVKYLAERRYNLVLVDVGDAMKYDSHPEISVPNAWEKDFLKKKLDEMRALGLEPIPKLNFSTGHDTWMKKYRRMVSTPEYYQFCADIIAEVCEVFGNPRFFHLGCDEEVPRKQQNHEMIIVRNAELWWHDFYFLCRECEKHGARPWIWSDYMWDNEELFLERMPKSVLQSNWFYGTFGNRDEKTLVRVPAYEVLDRHGYDQIPTGSTWGCRHNLYQTTAFCKERLDPKQLKGILAAPWLRTTAKEFHGLCYEADCLYEARKTFYPETLK